MTSLQLKTVLISLTLTSFLFLSCKKEPPQSAADDLTRFVNPLIGTAEHGHVYPGATVPFGAVQLSPDNGTQGWDWCSGYNYADSVIVGFSHTHLSGTGIGDLCDVSLMPTTGESVFPENSADPRKGAWASTFKHENEKASPGYYAVLLDNGIRAELTATTHAGMHRYSFPPDKPALLVLDLGFAINWDRPLDTRISVESPTLVTGYRYSTGWARDQRIYFALELSVPPGSVVLADSTALSEGSRVGGRQAKAVFDFSNAFENEKTLLVKVGISSADLAGAKAALAEIPHWNFDKIKNKAEALWQVELSKIQVVSTDKEITKTFYTALYRTCLAPVVFSDPNGNYKASTSGGPAEWNHTPPFPNGAQVRQAKGYTRYGIFSLWDTFRAANPLYTLTQPERINDFIRSMLAHYEEYGLLPIWELLGNETNTMTGYHAIPVIVDAYLKGYRGFDAELAFEAMKKSASQDIRGSNFYRQYGYIPYGLAGESVTRTLEYAFDDWCIAQMAKALGKQADYEEFMRRAGFYKNMFDASTGFMRAKLPDGKWKTPFDPYLSDHNFEVAEYTEGNAWQHAWFVPHDVEGLIALHGGKENFVKKLDSLFTVSSKLTGENVSADVTGLIGQYAHGNEPSHHIAYLYNFAGAPWKTQERVRHILETQYSATPAGLCGNEDCGQMSAWYVWSALGLYPVNPASGRYDIGSPLFEKAALTVSPPATPGTIRQFTIEAKGVSRENKYILSATLNGQSLDRAWLTHGEITAGGEGALGVGGGARGGVWGG